MGQAHVVAGQPSTDAHPGPRPPYPVPAQPPSSTDGQSLRALTLWPAPRHQLWPPAPSWPPGYASPSTPGPLGPPQPCWPWSHWSPQVFWPFWAISPPPTPPWTTTPRGAPSASCLPWTSKVPWSPGRWPRAAPCWPETWWPCRGWGRATLLACPAGWAAAPEGGSSAPHWRQPSESLSQADRYHPTLLHSYSFTDTATLGITAELIAVLWIVVNAKSLLSDIYLTPKLPFSRTLPIGSPLKLFCWVDYIFVLYIVLEMYVLVYINCFSTHIACPLPLVKYYCTILLFFFFHHSVMLLVIHIRESVKSRVSLYTFINRWIDTWYIHTYYI